jgi:hypothetical protein
LALFLALSAPALCGFVPTADDLGAFHLPLRAFYAKALESGEAWDWCPGLFGGFYLTGEGQAGTYHPLHLLLYRLLPLGWAWNIECLASYPFLFCGACLLLRRRGFAQAEALFGALVFTFCGFNLLHFVHVNAIAVAAHIPWLLYAIDRLVSRSADWQSVPTTSKTDWQSVLQSVCFIAALTGSQLLLGYPQYVAYSLLAEALYLALALHEQKRSVLRHGSAWLIAKVFGLALAAVQILPTFEAVADSVRQSADSSFSESGSLHPLNVVQLVAPYLFATRVVGQNTHELSLYVGIVPLLLAIVALSGPQSEYKAAATALRRFAVALGVLGGLLAVGKHGPLHQWLAHLPLAGYFRFPCRAVVLFELGFALLAAMGFAAIYRASRSERPLVLPRKTLWLVAVAGLGAAAAGPWLWPEYTAADWRVWFGPLVLLLAMVLLNLAAKGRPLALHAIVVLAAIDLGVYGLSYAVYRETYRLSDYIAHTPEPQTRRGERIALDLAGGNDKGLRVGNQILLAGFARIDGYAGLVPARALDYRQPAALRAASVAAVAANAPVAEAESLHAGGDGWLYIAEPLPRARLVRLHRATEEPAAEIARIDLGSQVLIERSRLAYVERSLGDSANALASADSVRIVSDRPGNVVIEVNTSRPAILVLNESYHRGWNVGSKQTGLAPTTKGWCPQRLPVPRPLRVNGDFLGCLVPAGHSTVEFRFAPTSLRYGRLVSVCGLGLIVILSAAAALPRLRALRGN